MAKIANADWDAEEIAPGVYRLFNRQTKSSLVVNESQLKSLIGIVEQID